MRKRVGDAGPRDLPESGKGWLDLSELASVEISSEDPGHPIEAALLADGSGGWRASRPGRQELRILFDEPRRLRRIQVSFRETERARAQEFVIRWSADGERYSELVRQQWNFSPDGSREETEEYVVDIEPVAVLELIIDPDRGGGEGLASIERLRVA